jgi:hypothetical protein
MPIVMQIDIPNHTDSLMTVRHSTSVFNAGCANVGFWSALDERAAKSKPIFDEGVTHETRT